MSFISQSRVRKTETTPGIVIERGVRIGFTVSYVSSREANTKNLCESNLLRRGSQENKREWDVGPEREGGQVKSTEGDWHSPTGSSSDSVSHASQSWS